MMTRLSEAQDLFLYQILGLDLMRESGSTLDKDQLSKNLESHDIVLTEAEIDTLYNSLLLPDSESIGKLDAYAKGHLFQLYSESAELNEVLNKIALTKGVTSEDL